METMEKTRRCTFEGCDTALSQYNDEDVCAQHTRMGFWLDLYKRGELAPQVALDFARANRIRRNNGTIVDVPFRRKINQTANAPWSFKNSIRAESTKLVSNEASWILSLDYAPDFQGEMRKMPARLVKTFRNVDVRNKTQLDPLTVPPAPHGTHNWFTPFFLDDMGYLVDSEIYVAIANLLPDDVALQGFTVDRSRSFVVGGLAWYHNGDMVAFLKGAPTRHANN